MWRIVLVAAVVVVLVLSGVLLYVMSVPKPPGNTPPHDLAILVTPSSGDNRTVFSFTAQAKDDQDPPSAIQVRWDWKDDGTWDTAWSTNKTGLYRFPQAGSYVIAMEARDTGGLAANATKGLTVSSPPNLPPRILGIGISPSTGNTTTTFTFTAQVTDDWDPTSAIQVRWDWQNDGIWDSSWSANKVATHVFPQPGNYTVRLEAKDTAGLTANGTRAVNVSAATRPQGPLRIGTILSLTGGLGPFGLGQQNGVDMAVDEINAAGGVLGQPIQVFHMDDQTTPSVAAQDAMTLITTDHVAAIIGATGSGMCGAVIAIAQANAVFEVSPSCTSPIFSNLSYTGGWFARTAASDALQAVVAAHFAYTNRSWRNVSVIGIDNAYGNGVASAFASNFTALGGHILIKEIVPQGQVDYTSYLQAVFAAGTPDGIYLIAYPDTGVVLIKDWYANRLSWPTSWLFSEGVYDQSSFIDPLVQAGVNVSGFEGTAPAAYAGFTPPLYAAWAARYQALYGSPPTLFAANAYDAVYLVALAAQASGNTTGRGIRSDLQAVADAPGTQVGPDQWSLSVQELAAGRDIDYNGASGSVDVGIHGDVPSAFIIWGVNAIDQLVTKEFFSEAFVIAITPPGTFAGAVASLRPASVATWSRETLP